MHTFRAAQGIILGCPGDTLQVAGERGERGLPVGGEVARRIARLMEQPCAVDELADGLLTARDGMRHMMMLTTAVRDLKSFGFIDEVVEIQGVVVARLMKKGRLPWREGDVPDDAVVARHVVATREGRWVKLDSGLGCGSVKVDASMAGHVLVGEDMAPGGRLSPLRELMWRAGLLVSASSEEAMEQTMWDPVDLLMIERSSDSSANFRYGGTYRYRETHAMPPLVEAIRVDEVVDLPEPDPDRWFLEDEPFGVITERRRSTSSFREDVAPTLKQLASVLHR